MKGIELRNFLYLNKINQEEAAKLVGVRRQTINNWCNKDLLTGDVLTKVKLIIEHFSEENMPKNSISNQNGVVINGGANDVDITNDHRQFYSDSPDVLRATIELLEERIREKDAQIREKDAQIREKDAQIREKDAQINKLLEILGKK